MPRHGRSEDPFAFATELAARLGSAPADLEIVRPSLEDIYLDLVADAAGEATVPRTARADLTKGAAR